MLRCCVSRAYVSLLSVFGPTDLGGALLRGLGDEALLNLDSKDPSIFDNIVARLLSYNRGVVLSSVALTL